MEWGYNSNKNVASSWNVLTTLILCFIPLRICRVSRVNSFGQSGHLMYVILLGKVICLWPQWTSCHRYWNLPKQYWLELYTTSKSLFYKFCCARTFWSCCHLALNKCSWSFSTKFIKDKRDINGFQFNDAFLSYWLAISLKYNCHQLVSENGSWTITEKTLYFVEVMVFDFWTEDSFQNLFHLIPNSSLDL